MGILIRSDDLLKRLQKLMEERNIFLNTRCVGKQLAEHHRTSGWECCLFRLGEFCCDDLARQFLYSSVANYALPIQILPCFYICLHAQTTPGGDGGRVRFSKNVSVGNVSPSCTHGGGRETSLVALRGRLLGKQRSLTSWDLVLMDLGYRRREAVP